METCLVSNLAGKTSAVSNIENITKFY